MTRYLVVDTETTGLFDFAKPADAAGQPRLAEFAGIVCTADPSEPATEHRYLVRPDGWEMTADGTEINGLTTEYLAERGAPVADVLAFYSAQIADGLIVVAHNAQYDTKIMRGEMRRADLPDLF